MDDKKLLELLRDGEHHKALDSLYDGYEPIRRFILKHGGTEDDTKDVFQEALIIFYQKAVQPDFKLTSKISTYVYSTCKYLWKDKLKFKNKFVSNEEFEINEDLDEDNLRDEIIENRYLDRVLKQLGDKCQAILEGYYVLKFSMQEISERFNYSSVGSAKNQKYKCLERAKKMAQEQLIQHSKLV